LFVKYIFENYRPKFLGALTPGIQQTAKIASQVAKELLKLIENNGLLQFSHSLVLVIVLGF
jgi:hypothetical protein